MSADRKVQPSIPTTTTRKVQKSPYELAREERLRRNQQVMRDLGLAKTTAELEIVLNKEQRENQPRKIEKKRKSIQVAPTRSQSKRARGTIKGSSAVKGNKEIDSDKLQKLQNLVKVYGKWSSS